MVIVCSNKRQNKFYIFYNSNINISNCIPTILSIFPFFNWSFYLFKMKKIFLVFFLLNCLSVFGQYTLDVNIGYNYHKSRDYSYPSYNLKKLLITGELINIGVQRRFSPLFAHSFGLGFINRSSTVLSTYASNFESQIDPVFTRYSHNFGRTQLYYSAKLWLFKIKELSLDFGVTLERALYHAKTVGDSKSIQLNNQLFIGIPLFNLGLSYDRKINENLSISVKLAVSKSYFSFFKSSYDPIFGYTYGGIDYRAQIGLNMPLSDNIKTPKEMWRYVMNDNEKKLSIQALEIKTFYRKGRRNFLFDDIPPLSIYCGYCEGGQTSNQTGNTYDGFGFGINYTLFRFFSTFEVALEHYETSLESVNRRNYYHPHLPYGKILDYYEERDYYSFTMDCINFSYGFGFKLFSPQRKFNIIPLIKFSTSNLRNLQVNSNYYTKERYRNWDMTQSPTYNISWDSTFVPSRFVAPDEKNSIFQYGAIVTIDIFKNFQLNADVFIGRKSKNSTNNSKIGKIDQLFYSTSIGLGYKIPFKRWKGG